MTCIFCEFVSGKRKRHNTSHPFLVIHETKHSISFLSNDTPFGEEEHTLVIPKRHFQNVADMPDYISNDVMKHIKLIVRAIRTKRHACNILLNDGESAGQEVMHPHFHLIPRDSGDGIGMQIWRHKKLTPLQFRKLSDDMKKRVKSLS